jgi:hypothetical protein
MSEPALDLYGVYRTLTQPSAVKKTPAGTYNLVAEKSSPALTYQGGKIISGGKVYNVFLGDWSSEKNQSRIERLNQFTEDLLSHKWMDALTQYGVKDKTDFIGAIQIENDDLELTNKEVQVILQKAVAEGKLPINNNNVYVIYLSDNTTVKDGFLNITMCVPDNDNAFGYHSYFITDKQEEFYYAIIPSLNDDCIGKTCLGSDTCSLKSFHTQEERQTQVASHEIVEVLTNPASVSWYDKNTGKENADICNGLSSVIVVGKNRWNVQHQYSQKDGAKLLGDYCLSYANYTDLIPVPDKYNLIGGGIAMLGLSIMAVKQNKGTFVIAACAVLGFTAGFTASALARKIIPSSKKELIKLRINKFGELLKSKR